MPALADPPVQQQAPPSAPTPDPQPAPQPTSIEAFDDQFKDLDHTPDPEPPKQIAPVETPPKPKEEPTDTPPPSKPPTTKEAPKEEPENYEPPKDGKPNELRGWALRMGKKAKDTETRMAEVVKELEALKRKPAPAPQADPVLTKQLAEAQKKIEEYEQNLRLVRYEQSDDYVTNHQKPINIAEAKAKRDIESLQVEVRQKEKHPETGEETERVVNTRPGTWTDFVNIYNLPRPEARRTAKNLFGEDSDQVMKHYDAIHDRYETAHLAVQEYREKGKAHEAQTEAEKKREADFMEQGWEKANAAFIAKSPQDFDQRDGDTEGNELLAKARSFVDLFMSDERERYPLPQRILADVRIANWASAFPRNQRDLKKLRAELADAQKTIEQLRGSGPGKPTSPDGQQTEQTETLSQAFDRMVPA